MRATLTVAAALAMLTGALDAAAHIQLNYPPARYQYTPTGQKTPQCASGTPTNIVTEFGTGQQVTVQWIETVNHPGHFRVSLDMTGTDDFSDPISFTDKQVVGNIVAYVDDNGGSTFEHTFTLPDQECDPCTLQVIQVMTDKAPYGDGNDIYYWCSDITIKVGGGTGGGPPTSTGSGATTGSGSGSGSGSGGSTTSGAGGSTGTGLLGTPDSGDEGGCSVVSAPGRSSRAAGWLALLLGLGCLARRRR